MELPPQPELREITHKFGSATFYPHRSTSVSQFNSTMKTHFGNPKATSIAPYFLNMKSTGYQKNPLTNDLDTYHKGVVDTPEQRFQSEYHTRFNQKRNEYFR